MKQSKKLVSKSGNGRILIDCPEVKKNLQRNDMYIDNLRKRYNIPRDDKDLVGAHMSNFVTSQDLFGEKKLREDRAQLVS